MIGIFIRWMVALALLGGLAACNRDGGNGRPLLNLRGSAVPPDEFLVVPQKPLETPSSLSALPSPEPGATNLVEIDFEGRLMQALGGRKAVAGGIPASEMALVRAVQASAGSTAGIRDILRQEDQAFREDRAGRIARLARKRKAVTIYDNMLLDAYDELARLRALGVKAPAAPPQ